MNTSFYSKSELAQIGFSKIGNNVLISRKCSIYSPQNISLGDNVRIDDFTILSGNIEICNYVHIAAFCFLCSGEYKIKMDDYSGVSSKTSIYAATDDYSGEYMTNPTIDNKYRNVKGQDVYIGKHVVVGTGSVILPGAYLMEGNSFGAMSLIVGNYTEWGINVGIPAKKIKNRSKNLLKYESKLLAFKD